MVRAGDTSATTAEGDTKGGHYKDARAAVEDANVGVNKNPEANVDTLVAALQRLESFEAELADDPETREIVELARLNLARAYLVMDDRAGAEAVMDQVVRISRDRTPAVDRFGPTLVDFYDARLRALDEKGRGEIAIDCSRSCQVTLDTVPIAPSSGPLFLGTYRVWVRSTDGSVEERREVELAHAGAIEVIEFPAPATSKEGASGLSGLSGLSGGADAAGWERVMPRWAEASLMVAGIGALVGGAVMLRADGRCIGGVAIDPMLDAQDCPELYESTGAGAAMIGLGAAAAVAGGVLLTVDEVRVGRESGRQATLTWTLRF